jgi:hypothetical protein
VGIVCSYCGKVVSYATGTCAHSQPSLRGRRRSTNHPRVLPKFGVSPRCGSPSDQASTPDWTYPRVWFSSYAVKGSGSGAQQAVPGLPVPQMRPQAFHGDPARGDGLSTPAETLHPPGERSRPCRTPPSPAPAPPRLLVNDTRMHQACVRRSNASRVRHVNESFVRTMRGCMGVSILAVSRRLIARSLPPELCTTYVGALTRTHTSCITQRRTCVSRAHPRVGSSCCARVRYPSNRTSGGMGVWGGCVRSYYPAWRSATRGA